MTNLEIVKLLRQVAAAYEILDENRFKIIAYTRAADSVEHLTSEVKDMWDNNKLDQIPGVGKMIQSHLDELFRTGKVQHFDKIINSLPEAIFPLLNVPGLGPKKAFKLVSILKLKSANTVVRDLKAACKKNKVSNIEGFGKKSQAQIIENLQLFQKGAVKENRMLLSEAENIAVDIETHLKKNEFVLKVDTLGSLRRKVSTVGDVDIAAATKHPQIVVRHFLKYPHQKLIEKGPTGASVLLHNGRQVDLRVIDLDSYGSMLQYFTGSKHHNIALRSYALKKGLSLSEYGIKNLKTQKLSKYKDEKNFYTALGLEYVPPELREDRGEIDSVLRQAQGKPNGLPSLIQLADIVGDLHLHTNYNLEPSHDLGSDDITTILKKAENLGYKYIGISDHNPSVSKHTEKQIISIMKRRKAYYEQKYCSYIKSTQKHYNRSKDRIKIFIMLEVDILASGEIALPDKAFDFVDAVIVSVHSSFTQKKDIMTERVMKGLTGNLKVKIFGHPTARLLTGREGIDLDWDEVFQVCLDRNIACEINAHPMRLDLPDDLVFDAVKNGVKLVINTDAHASDQMDNMKYGVSTARRGWASKNDIINTFDYKEIKNWLEG